MSRPGPHHAAAVAVYDVPGPRFREGIIRDIERALESVAKEAAAEAGLAARRAALLESRAITAGMIQALQLRDRTLEQELNEIERLRAERRKR